jgi:protein O-GlcNAc transferase
MTPAHAQQALKHALAHHKAGRLAEAASGYQRVRAVQPRNFDALHLGGLVAMQQKKWAEAHALLARAHQVDPRSAQAAMRLGAVLMELGRGAEAVPALEAAVASEAGLVEAWNLLARCYKLLDRLSDAVKCHTRSLELKPEATTSWYNYGLTLNLLGRSGEALAAHERALGIDAAFHQGHLGRAQALLACHRPQEAVAALDEFLRHEPNHSEAHSSRLFALNNLPDLSREQLFAEHAAYGKLFPAPPEPRFAVSRDPERRLRLAILSPDLREHSCAYFMEPLLRHLERNAWEVFLYHDHFRVDAVGERLKGYAHVWRHVVLKTNDQLEALIRSDAPDILMDLAGHTGLCNRLPLFARRLAPVQVNYLGYPNTTGLPAMDYRFTDGIADPLGEADALATERLVRFAPTAWTYQAPEGAPACQPPPCTGGAPVTFGCFNHPAKITAQMLGTWAAILERVPGSRLLLKGRGFSQPAARERYVEGFVRHGVSADRVHFAERTQGTLEHLAIYHRVDIALDTFPYHGTTTTCEALWMGLPVVSLHGDRHLARVGTSLLSAIGHAEWIAADVEDYVRIAVGLAQDPARLAGYRAGLRGEITSSPLGDHAGQTARFASALRGCWRAWVQKQGAAHLSLPARGALVAA